METIKRGRKPIYHTDEERINARRVSQQNYYNRIKDSRRELINLMSLRRYYKRQLANNPSEKHEKRLSDIEGKISCVKLHQTE